jgi:hypothetical protein
MPESDDRDLAERVAAPLRAPEPVDATFEARLMAGARGAIARGEAPWQQPNVFAQRRPRRSWLTTPRELVLSPLAGLAAAAVFAGLIVGVTLAVSRSGGSATQPVVAVAAPTTHETVRFVIVAPSAHDVALVGDFNGWNPAATPLTRDAAGRVWTVTMPLAAGTYQYAFVVDGRAWLADPNAPFSMEDEFGAPSSVLTVNVRRT